MMSTGSGKIIVAWRSLAIWPSVWRYRSWRPPSSELMISASHRALHRLRQLDIADLHRGDLDPPGFGLLVDEPLKLGVDLVAAGKQRIQIGLPEDAPQGRLAHQ